MPVYEYQCESCGRIIEKIQKFSDAPLTKCKECGGPLKKLLSPPALVFKGSGFYITDYAQKKPEKEKPATGKDQASTPKSKESSATSTTTSSSGSSSSSSSSSSNSPSSKDSKS